MDCIASPIGMAIVALGCVGRLINFIHFNDRGEARIGEGADEVQLALPYPALPCLVCLAPLRPWLVDVLRLCMHVRTGGDSVPA